MAIGTAPLRPVGAPADRRRRGGGGLWRRWVGVTTAGEVAGFAVPAGVAAAMGDALSGVPGLLVLVLAGAVEGSVLGWAQGRVLRREVPGWSTRDWTVRTAAAAALAWAIGMAPSTLGSRFSDLALPVQLTVLAPAGVVLLLSVGAAQWTVLRRHVPGAGAWVGWTALGWLAGLALFTAVATPLWQPGQPVWLVAGIGACAGLLMAVAMAAVTGAGLVRLLRRPATRGTAGPVPAGTARPWELPAPQVAADLHVDPAVGLDARTAADRLAAEGPNEVRTRRPVSLAGSVLTQLRDPMVLVLLAAGVLTAVTGDLVDCGVIGLVVVVNTTLGVVQERRAIRAVQALGTLVAPLARVLRDGRDVWVPTRELVRGDVLRLAAGDVVGADARLLQTSALQVDESLLTGEALPVDREARARSPRDGRVGDRPGMVHAGSVVMRGRGLAVVVATGADSAVGQLAALVHERPSPPTPLQRRLARLGRQISLGVAGVCVLFVLSGLVRGQPWETTVVAGVALAVAAVPESLPAVVTLALAGGAARMSRRGAVVRSLPAVETLGSVTLLATDKTGTLTAGAMRVDRVWTPVDGDLPTDPGALPPTACALVTAAALCNDGDPTGGGAEGTAGTADTETALVRAALAAGVDVAAVRAARPRVHEEPFDAVSRRMTTVHRLPGGATTVVVKGAPEAVLPAVGGHPGAAAVAGAWSLAGRRVLAVAQDGRLLGLLGLADPVRPEAAAAVRSCHRAGIRPVLVTGDHAGTAEAVARQVGIVDAAHPVADSVLARVEPEGKLRHVTGWQAAGHVVAMTGDGVNDAPALRAADIGVAMGRRGTEVAKEAADLVLADDSLATVTAAVGEGRRVFDDVRRFVGYGLAGGLAEVLVMLLGPFAGLALPLLPAQVLWVNLLTHGPVGVAMGTEPAAPDVLSRPPRAPSSGVLDRALVRQVAATGAGLAAVSLAVAVVSRSGQGPWQTQLFVALATGQLALALALRPPGAWRARPRAVWVPVAVAGNAVLLLAALHLPALRDLLGTVPLSAAELAAAAVPALLPACAVAVAQRRPGRRPAPDPEPPSRGVREARAEELARCRDDEEQ
ncbi:HAD-IC family P-type ATPase [Modestobacter sp. SSW1-42]|uniref:cation-translocating P-type ATPase n=1 Tax=Modestobacter sp. SSW1-42 TaxID=596372 RepID=UPI0039886D3C